MRRAIVDLRRTEPRSRVAHYRSLGLSANVALETRVQTLVSKVCQSLSVLFLGKVIEDTNVFSFFDSPTHPYSKALLAATPKYTDPESDLIPVSEEILNSVKEEVVQLDLEWSNGR